MIVYEQPRPYYCVYAHYLKGRLLYIGCGCPERARNLNPNVRNRLWRQAVKNRSDVSVVIFRRFCSFLNAERYERKKIEELLPPANILYNRKVFMREFLNRRSAKR